MFTKLERYCDCYIYEGAQFEFEIVPGFDDCYHKNTLLFYVLDTPATIYDSFKTSFANEIDLDKWNNKEFKKFLDNISENKSYVYECFVKEDEKIPIKITYDNDTKTLTVPLREGSYYITDIGVRMDDIALNELRLLHENIDKYYK